ncbi:hypothetical protein GJU41_11810 [Bacillus idriensis]|uniref:Uncharacterized protein n=1 Tax=Metabacillus idriensis TaxID=324768 RepID=A0A6I2M951_9BACI|nr:hypothetical protein [Metabacillus idriensis]MRX54658.1 hypothetical protein [Metabacillus idriensis]
MTDKLFAPPSQLPYRNRLVYLMQTKLGTELPEDILHDIDHALYDYAKYCAKVARDEAEANAKVAEGRALTIAEHDAETAIEFITEWYRNSRVK